MTLRATTGARGCQLITHRRGGFFRRRRATILARSADQSGRRRHGCRDKPAPTATEKGGISQASPQLSNMMLHAVWKVRPAKRQCTSRYPRGVCQDLLVYLTGNGEVCCRTDFTSPKSLHGERHREKPAQFFISFLAHCGLGEAKEPPVGVCQSCGH